MNLFQRPPITDLSSTLFRVDSETFAELLQQTRDSYIFNFNFRLAVSSGRKNLRDYSKVVITIRDKAESSSTQNAMSNDNLIQTSNRLSSLSNVSLLNSVRPNNGFTTPKVPAKVANKLYSGIKLVKDIQTTVDYIERVEIPLSSYIQNIDYNYNFVELFSTANKPITKDGRRRDVAVTNNSIDPKNEVSTLVNDSSKISPTDVIERINAELCDITLPVSDPELLQINSESYLDNPKLRMAEIAKGRPALFYDITKYYLNDVKSSDQENTQTWYQARSVTKPLDNVEITQTVTIKKSTKNQTLFVKFDLYKTNSNVIDESFTCDLSMSPHVEAFESITRPPTVTTSNIPGTKFCNISITDNEIPGRVQSFNVYSKSVTAQGTVGSYQKIAEVSNDVNNEILIILDSQLTVIRVIPVDSQNKESTTYTNVIAGLGHKVVGNLTIAPFHFGKNEIKVEVFNIPRDAVSLSLYRRDCTENVDSMFDVIVSQKLSEGSINLNLVDENTEIGKTYEYYCICSTVNMDSNVETPVISNYVMFRNIRSSIADRSIDVTLNNSNTTYDEGGYRLSFELKTNISKLENEKITQILKEQIGELYDQYLNPANNTSSPLGDDSKGVPRYSDLFFHEIVRTNLNTSERETFEIVSDGTFVDGPETQRIFNIKPINPQHSYLYQVFTYKKNPIELFKKFVAWGVDDKGKEWFYLPYKWKNATVKLGKLYADDETGTPIIDTYENFTSESYGLTATYRIESSRDYTTLTQIVASRIDRNTVKVSWSPSIDKPEIYDSFVVMKVVNGIRSFVGRTHKNYIYHELNSYNDLGSIYYIIVPIMSEFDIDDPGYSNTVFISTQGLTSRSLAQPIRNSFNDTSKLSLKNSAVSNASQINSINVELKTSANISKVTSQIATESIKQLSRIRRS